MKIKEQNIAKLRSCLPLFWRGLGRGAFIFLLAALFVACGDSDDDGIPERDYIDPNTIAGEWYWIQFIDSTVISIQDGYISEKIYNKYDGRLTQSIKPSAFKITNDRLYYTKILEHNGIPYKLDNDTLFFSWAEDILSWTKYIRIK